MVRVFSIIVAAALCALVSPASAQDREVPYWASIRADEVNMRVGPAGTYRIVWVYKRRDLPVKVLRIKEGWRLVEDPDGEQGWMVARFLKRERTAIVTGEELVEMRAEPDAAARLLWKVEPGAVGLLGDCEAGWCSFDVGGNRGFAPADRLWGASEAP